MVRLRNSAAPGPSSGLPSSSSNSNHRSTASSGAPHTTPLPTTIQSLSQHQTNSSLPLVPPPPIITSAIVSSSGPSGGSGIIIAPSPTSGSLIQRRRRTSSTSISPHGSILISSGGGGGRGVGRTLSNASSSWEIETTPSMEQLQQDEFYDYEHQQHNQQQSQSQYMFGGYSYHDPQQQQSQQSSYQYQPRQRTATYPARQSTTPTTTKNTTATTTTNKVIDLNQPHNSYYYSHHQATTTNNTNTTTHSSSSQQQHSGYGDKLSYRSSQHSYKFDSDYYNDISEHTADTGFYDDLNILEAGGSGSLSSPRLRKGSPRQQVVSGIGSTTTTGRRGIFSDETKKNEKLLEALQAPKLEDYHVTFRTPLHVPDRDYKKFLESTSTDDDERGRLLLKLRPGRKINYDRKGSSSSRAGSGACTKQCCAGTCAGFSLIGFLFLLMIGILLDTQPLYIRGSLPELIAESSSTRTTKKNVIQRVIPKRSNSFLAKESNSNNNTTIQRLPTASNAYKAAMLYLISFLFSLYCIYPDSINQKFILLWQRIQRLLEMSGIVHKVRVSAVCYYTKRRIRRFLRQYCRWCYTSRDPRYYYYDDIPDNHISDSAATLLPTTYRSNDHPYHYSNNNNNNSAMDGVGTGNSGTTRSPTNYLGDSMSVMSSYIQSFWRPSFQDSHRTRRRRRRRRNSDRGGVDQGGGIDVVMGTGGSSSLGITIGSGAEDDDDEDDFINDHHRRTKNDPLLPLRHTNAGNKHYPTSSSLSAAAGSNHSVSSIGTSSYHAYSSNYNDTGIWNRTKGRIQQFLTVRGFYFNPPRRSRKYGQKKREV